MVLGASVRVEFGQPVPRYGATHKLIHGHEQHHRR